MFDPKAPKGAFFIEWENSVKDYETRLWKGRAYKKWGALIGPLKDKVLRKEFVREVKETR